MDALFFYFGCIVGFPLGLFAAAMLAFGKSVEQDHD